MIKKIIWVLIFTVFLFSLGLNNNFYINNYKKNILKNSKIFFKNLNLKNSEINFSAKNLSEINYLVKINSILNIEEKNIYLKNNFSWNFKNKNPLDNTSATLSWSLLSIFNLENTNFYLKVDDFEYKNMQELYADVNFQNIKNNKNIWFLKAFGYFIKDYNDLFQNFYRYQIFDVTKKTKKLNYTRYNLILNKNNLRNIFWEYFDDSVVFSGFIDISDTDNNTFNLNWNLTTDYYNFPINISNSQKQLKIIFDEIKLDLEKIDNSLIWTFNFYNIYNLNLSIKKVDKKINILINWKDAENQIEISIIMFPTKQKININIPTNFKLIQ